MKFVLHLPFFKSQNATKIKKLCKKLKAAQLKNIFKH